jgi:hypothetical protein
MWDENQAVPVPDVVLQRPNPRIALAVWLLLLLIPGIGGLLLHLQELAGLVALAGLFIAAQAADMDPQWFVLNSVLSLIVPVGGSLSFAALAVFVWQGDSPEAARAVATLFCAAASLFALASAWPNVARWLVRVLFRGSDDSSTLRLAARRSCSPARACSPVSCSATWC